MDSIESDKERGARFETGRLYATPGALEAIAEARQSPAELVKRHASGDWGDLGDEHDRRLNEEATSGGDDRIWSAYNLSNGARIWVITVWDRSYTTLMLPEEY